MKLLHFLSLLLALSPVTDAQTRWADLTPEARAAKIEAVRDARRQRIRAEHIANRQKAKAEGRVEARATRVRDRALMAVWTRLTPEVQAMYAARGLAEMLGRRPEWETQTRAERIAAATDFITNYQEIKAGRQQATMDAALGATGGAYPAPPATAELARVLNAKPDEIPALNKAGDPVELAAAVQPPAIPAFPEVEVPDLFTINRRVQLGQAPRPVDEPDAQGHRRRQGRGRHRNLRGADRALLRLGREIPPALEPLTPATGDAPAIRHRVRPEGIVGTASPVLGVITSFQEQIEWHLRIASLLVGLAVGVLSLIGLWRKLRGRR